MPPLAGRASGGSGRRVDRGYCGGTLDEVFGIDEEEGVPVPLTVPVLLLDAPPDIAPRFDLVIDLGRLIFELPMLLVVALEPVVGP